MNTLEDLLSMAKRARLIPTVADSRKEERLVSVLLSTMSMVRPLATRFLDRCGERMGKTSALDAFAEVAVPSEDGNGSDRPDGLLCLRTRKSRWTALIEAKIDKHDIDVEQVQRYGEIARRLGVNAVVTLSNQLVALPSHIPYSVPKRLSNKVKFVHMSWISILTDASLILRDRDGIAAEQAFVLEEMRRYFEHQSSGVRRFDQMNPEWRQLVLGIRDGQKFKRTSPEIENTVASWHQEERDICLILSRRIGTRVGVRLPRKHQNDPEMRLRETAAALIDKQELQSCFTIPNAASDLEVSTSLGRRTISCSMSVNAPANLKRSSARVNWLLRQLRDVDGDDVIIRASRPWSREQTQAPLPKVREAPSCLDGERRDAAPSSFEVVVNRDLVGRYSGRRTFIEDLEALVPDYYERIGQKLRQWVPPPLSIDKRDPIENTDNHDRNRNESEEEPENH